MTAARRRVRSLSAVLPSTRRDSCPLFVLAWLMALLVSPGHFGSVDAERRFQVTRSLWTAEPEVRSDDADFGIVGTGGQRRAWYGVGQSLVLLPADVVVSTALSVTGVVDAWDDAQRRRVVGALVVLAAAPILAALVVFHAHRLLAALGLPRSAAAAGALSLLAATSFLHYAQLLQENVLALLLVLAALDRGLQWVRDANRLALAGAAACLGFLLLLRLTMLIDVIAVAGALAAFTWRWSDPAVRPRRLVVLALAIGAAVLAGLSIDRLYHFERFGAWTGTYIGLFGDAARAADSDLPATFPFNVPFATGFAGAFLSPRKSVFLFDPLLAVALVLLPITRRTAPPDVRTFAMAAACVLVGHAAFHARYFAWGGDAAWGDRFVVSAAQLLAMLAVPLVLSRRWPRPFAIGLWCVVGVGVMVQLASVVFTFNLEIAQIQQGTGSTFIVGQRFVNLWTSLTGEPVEPALAPMFRPALWPATFAAVIGPAGSRVAWTIWASLLVAAGVVALRLGRTVRRGADARCD